MLAGRRGDAKGKGTDEAKNTKERGYSAKSMGITHGSYNPLGPLIHHNGRGPPPSSSPMGGISP